MIYLERITGGTLSTQAYERIREMIVDLRLAPGEVVREDALQQALGIGRTPIREALQRLARDQFVVVIPRRGTLVASIEVSELSLLYETRAQMEPYAARLAAARGTPAHWAEMRVAISEAKGVSDARALLAIDRRCHEITWEAAGNRFLTGALDVLYAQSVRVWHMYLAVVADMHHAVEEHAEILDALEAGDEHTAGSLVEAHVRSFDDQVRRAVTARLAPPLSATATVVADFAQTKSIPRATGERERGTYRRSER